MVTCSVPSQSVASVPAVDVASSPKAVDASSSTAMAEEAPRQPSPPSFLEETSGWTTGDGAMPLQPDGGAGGGGGGTTTQASGLANAARRSENDESPIATSSSTAGKLRVSARSRPITLTGFASLRAPSPSWYDGAPLDDDPAPDLPLRLQRPAIVGDGVGAGVQAGVEAVGC